MFLSLRTILLELDRKKSQSRVDANLGILLEEKNGEEKFHKHAIWILSRIYMEVRSGRKGALETE